MDQELRKLNAAIAFSGIPKKVLARYVGVDRAKFSRYILGDLRMPEAIRERLLNRLRSEIQRIQKEEGGVAQQQVAQ